LQHTATFVGYNHVRPRSNPADASLSYFAGIAKQQMVIYYANFELIV
jgi:hypothetical protein